MRDRADFHLPPLPTLLPHWENPMESRAGTAAEAAPLRGRRIDALLPYPDRPLPSPMHGDPPTGARDYPLSASFRLFFAPVVQLRRRNPSICSLTARLTL